MSGKYNFSGIKEMGASGLRGAALSSPYTAWINKFGSLSTLFYEFLANWLANKGLIILNLGAIAIDGHFDQKAFDKALDKAYADIENAGGVSKLTPEEIKAIDNEVIKAARRFILLTKP